MPIGSHEGSARIYQFPLGGRRCLTAASRQAVKVEADAAPPRLPKMVAGSGWYHEAAIEEARRSAKR